MSAQTLRGPLTAFDPPSSCFDQLWYNSRSDTVLGNPYDTNCKPSGWNTNVQYSPAVCPLSYYSASRRLATAGTVTETVVDCCPSSFVADPGDYHCLSSFDAFSTVAFFTFSTDQSLSTTTVYSPTNGINAHSIQVRYQSSDLALLALASGTTATSAASTTSAASATSQSSVPTASSTGTLSTTSTSTSSFTSVPSSSPTASPIGGLSTGAKAGIGIGIACGVILVLAVIWVVVRARKSKLASAKQPPHYDYQSGHPAEKYSHHLQPSELAMPVNELPDSQGPSRNELPGT